jgi:hypothetical protein
METKSNFYVKDKPRSCWGPVVCMCRVDDYFNRVPRISLSYGSWHVRSVCFDKVTRSRMDSLGQIQGHESHVVANSCLSVSAKREPCPTRTDTNQNSDKVLFATFGRVVQCCARATT